MPYGSEGSNVGKLTVGVIGAGRIARSAHMSAWGACSEQVEVRIVADVDLGRAESFANDYGIERWTDRIADVLEDTSIDAVDICLPAPLHASAIAGAIAREKHVFTEKPFVIDPGEAHDLVARQEAAGRVLMVAQNWIYSPAVAAAIDVVEQGKIGEALLFHSRYESPLYLEFETVQQLEERRRYTGAGFTMAAGVHALNLALYVLGPASEVIAYSAPTAVSGVPLMDQSTAVSIRFESGAIGSFSFSGEARRPGPRIMEVSMLGTSGSIELDVENSTISWSNREHTERIGVEASLGFVEEVEHFLECVRDGREPRTSGRQQVDAVQVVKCVYESLERGEPIAVPPS